MNVMIGLTPSVSDNTKQILQNRDYADAVIRVGAVPVILPMTEESHVLDQLVAELDGFVFSGGADLGPELYGQEKLPVCGDTSPVRDRVEMYLLKKCLAVQKPFLAICRGFELFNVALGGTLYQDIETQRPDSLFHPCYDKPADQVHEVDIEPGTMLQQIVQNNRIRVNSRHHQGVCGIGKGLIVSGRASDGLIEALELPGHPFAVGVQWHPETLSSYVPEAVRLFGALKDAAARGKA